MTGPQCIVSLPAGTTADETLGHWLDCSEYEYVTVYVIGSDTINAGVITIEEAYWDDDEMPYGGTWSSIGTVNAADVTGGAQKASHLSVGAYRAVRAHVTTAIGGGGSIKVVICGSGGRD